MPGSDLDSRTKQLPCARCGETVARPFRFYGRAYHTECASDEMADNLRQLRAKSGPYYWHWLESGGANGRPKGTGGGIKGFRLCAFDASISMRL